MRPLRAYLLVRYKEKEWAVNVHSDLESLVADFQSSADRSQITSVIHIGFDRPDTAEFETVASRFAGRVIFTAAARYAFPSPVEVASSSVGNARHLPLFVALTGWGYTCTAEDLGLGEEDDMETGPIPGAERSGWVVDLANHEPGLAAIATAAGIYDEGTYLALEPRLTADERTRLALFRLRKLVGTDQPEDPIIIARYSPPWLLERPTASLDLTVRLHHIFSHDNITKVSELLHFGSAAGLLRLQNFGRRSLNDLAQSLLSAIREGPITETDRTLQAESRNLLLHIRTEIDELPKRDAYILRRRIGLDANPGTLQVIGDELQISRAGVRQIEAICIEKLRRKALWPDLLVNKLETVINDRAVPLLSHSLCILDPWFLGMDQRPAVFDYILEKFCGSRFYLLDIDGQLLISALSPNAWVEAVSQATRLLEGVVGDSWTEQQARTMVDGLLPGPGHELRDLLWDTASGKAHFVLGPDGQPILTGFGRGAKEVVRAVLEEADRPLHFSEIAERAFERTGLNIRQTYIACTDVGLRYGRGTFGLLKHLPLSVEEADDALADLEYTIAHGPEERQWHCDELCKLMGEVGCDFDGRLTPYVVNILLRKSTICSDLGRFIFIHKQEHVPATAHRIDVHHAVISILRRAGHPLTTSEIHDELIQDRGLGEHFQIHAVQPIIRLSKGLWGLIDRDSDLN